MSTFERYRPSALAALGWLHEFATPGEQEAARRVLSGLGAEDQSDDDLSVDLCPGQLQDGGWAPPWASGRAGIDATCDRVSRLYFFARGSTALQRGLDFLALRQQPEGPYGEDPDLAAIAPHWARPGDPTAIGYMTANAAFLLRAGGRRDASDRALGWLRPRNRAKAFLQEHWLYASALRLSGDLVASESAIAPIAPNLGKMSAGDLAWLLLSMRAAGFPEDHHMRRRAVAVLVGLQNSDGSFPGGAGAPRDIRVTLDAVGAIAPVRAQT